MILRLSQKLAQKLKTTPKTCAPLDPNPFADWSAHLFTADRTQYFLVTNTVSLYSVVMFARGISDDCRFIDRALSVLHEYMEYDGTEFLYQRFVAPASPRVRISKALNRSVTGSITDMVRCAKILFADDEMAPPDVADHLNNTPMSALNYENPRNAFTNLQPE